MIRRTLFAASLTVLSATAAERVKLELSADDRMAFSKTAFEVVSGRQVTLVFKNTSKLGAKSMKHNVVLLKPGNTVIAFAMKCHNAADKGYVPDDKEAKAQMVGHTRLIGGGETASFSFVAGEPGKYPFFCSSPGHFDKMQGVITVVAE